MKKERKPSVPQRRDFLRGSIAAGAGVAIAATLPSMAVAATSNAVDDTHKRDAGYQLSQHVAEYYKTCTR